MTLANISMDSEVRFASLWKGGLYHTQKKEMSPLLDKNHIIIFKLLKILSFLNQLNLVVLFESKSTPYQVYLAALVCPTQLCLLKLQHP